MSPAMASAQPGTKPWPAAAAAVRPVIGSTLKLTRTRPSGPRAAFAPAPPPWQTPPSLRPRRASGRTQRWGLAAAAAPGLLGLVLKVSEISRPGKSTGSAPMRAARSSERHAASAPAVQGHADWPSAAPAPEPGADPEVREPVDTTRGL